MDSRGILAIVLWLVVIKAMTIGSEFSFGLWAKHKKKYTKWYFNREKFKP